MTDLEAVCNIKDEFRKLSCEMIANFVNDYTPLPTSEMVYVVITSSDDYVFYVWADTIDNLSENLTHFLSIKGYY